MANDRPWLKNYPPGVPVNVDTLKYDSLIELINERLKQFANNNAFECMGKIITFKELDQLSDNFGAYLQSRGLNPGDKIALMMPNILQYPIALIGALKAGLVIVNTNPLYTPREMEHQFKDSGAKAILIAENFAANLEKVIGNTNIKVVITTSIGELLGMVKGSVLDFVVKNIKRGIPNYNIDNSVDFKTALSQGKKFKINTPSTCQEDTVVLQYTGGTTGVSKGAMLTNGNLVANLLQFDALASKYMKEGVEVGLCPLPLYHIFAFVVNMLYIMNIGGMTVLITNPRDLSTIVKAWEKNKITFMTGVNTLFNTLLNNEEFKALDFSSLKIVGGGGTAVQTPVAKKWQEVTGCFLAEGYGLTETSPVATFNPLEAGQIGTIGVPIPSTDLRIVSESGEILGVNEVGEIQIKGPQVMKGYYNRPEETASVIKDGWLSTGDIGRMREDCFFQIVDRKKDMILVSGFNVYPNEIEDVLAAHPKILESAAIGVPNEKSGEAVKIFVVKSDDSLNEKDLIQYCRENLTGYKVPKHIKFIKELPKSPVGKILRRELR